MKAEFGIRVSQGEIHCIGTDGITARRRVIGAELAKEMYFVIQLVLRCACGSDSHRLPISASGETIFGSEPWSQMPQEVGLYRRAGKNVSDRPVESMQIASCFAVVESSVYGVNHRCAEGIRAHIGEMHSRANGIEGARSVEPVCRAENPLVAKKQLLTAGANGEMILFKIPQFQKSLSQVERVLKRKCGGDGSIPQYTRILHLCKYAEPGVTHIHVQLKTAQQIALIVAGRVPASFVAFCPDAILAREAQPGRKFLVGGAENAPLCGAGRRLAANAPLHQK